MKSHLDRDGYQAIELNYMGKTKYCHIHRLIAEAYIPNPENKPTVDHINRVRTDNRICNLRWATHKEQSDNISNDVRKQAIESAKKKKGKKVIMRDKKNHDLIYRVFDTSVEAAEYLSGDKTKNSRICRVANGHAKSALGYYWTH